ncbi:EGF-like domain-containing protein [Tieghemostelium lacteum]|uniref:EGF-like domain-containing protein n=1 Tax=Tieghemostelium lacteum TaxID=361077 RepID=A0A151Z7N4_TIELA|nr:EGF-like domain-containing protein [Tieghemostelium lacteum]|eukprot:KYQ89970.1 EGF-like domain-containing protein [Tieghemostelium lacteum]
MYNYITGNKNSSLSFIYLLFIYLFISNVSYGFRLVDITPPKENNNYADPGNNCIFNYWIAIYRENGDGPLNYAQINSNIETDSFSPEFITGTVMFGVFTARFTGGESGSFEISMGANEISNAVFKYSCDSPPNPVVILEQSEWKNTGVSFYTSLKLNLNKYMYMAPQSQNPYICTNTLLGYDTLILECHIDQTFSGTFSDIQITGLGSTISIPTFITNDNREAFVNVNVYSYSATPGLAFKDLIFVSNVKHQSGNYITGELEVQARSYFATRRNIVEGSPDDMTIMMINTFKGYSNYQEMINFTTTTYSHNDISNDLQQFNYDGNTLNLLDPLEVNNMIANYTNVIDNLIEAPVEIQGFYDFPITYQFGTFLYKIEYLRYPNTFVSYNSGGISNNVFILYIPRFQEDLSVSHTEHTFIPIDPFTNFPPDETSPTISNVEIIPLKGTTMLIKVKVLDSDSGVYSIQVGSDNYENILIELSSKDLSSGTINNGWFTKYIDIADILKDVDYYFFYGAIDRNGVAVGSSYPVNRDDGIFFPSNFPNVPLPAYYQMVDNQVSYVTFLIPYCDLSVIGCENTIFINFTQANPSLAVRVVLSVDNDIIFTARWNEKYSLYTGDFVMKPRAFSGVIPYTLYYNTLGYSSVSLPDSYQFTIYSEYADRMPPVINSFDKSPDLTNTQGGQVSWSFNIQDQLNGIKYAKFQVTSSLNPYNPKTFEFNLQPNGSVVHNVLVSVTVPPQCLDQTFTITYVELIDDSDVASVYNNLTYLYQIMEYSIDFPINPFMKILNSFDSNLTIPVSCNQAAPTDTTPPTLTNVVITQSTIDVSSPNRNLEIIFTLNDTDSAISITEPATCMIYGVLFETLSVKSILVSNDTSNFSATFVCSIDLPYGFGFTEELVYIGIFGYTDVNWNFGSSTPTQIYQAGLASSFSVNFTQEYPVIDYVLPIGEDGQLTIIGHNFGDPNVTDDVIVKVLYDYADGNPSSGSYTPKLYDSVIIVVNPVVGKVITNITVIKDGKPSNTYNGGSKAEFPVTPVCPGTPQCGGPTNGKCTTFGCKCSEGWSGFDCLSKVVIITPSINNTNPTIDNEIPLPDGETATLRSLINILSLREIKLDGTIVADHKFNVWYFRNLSLPRSTIQEFQYTSGLTNNGKVTNITVNIQYFTQAQTIVFANEALDMKPSTIKYKISLSHYEFTSNLNTLELMMTATFESNNIQSSCTSQEQGSLIDNGTDFVKLQLNENSLYARFVKRAIIDNRVQSISNTFYNSTTTTVNVQEQTATSISNLIGIKIPNYRFNALLDPDFSVLLDAKPVTSDSSPNSICSISESKDSSKLSKAQLAGIIIGAVGFGIVAAVSITYYIYKKKQYAKTVLKIQNKVAAMQPN